MLLEQFFVLFVGHGNCHGRIWRAGKFSCRQAWDESNGCALSSVQGLDGFLQFTRGTVVPTVRREPNWIIVVIVPRNLLCSTAFQVDAMDSGVDTVLSAI
jgi:hypothetical protein